jgi:hypothetical protein
MLEGILIGVIAVFMVFGFLGEQRERRHFCAEVLPVRIAEKQRALDDPSISLDRRSSLRTQLWNLEEKQRKCEE